MNKKRFAGLLMSSLMAVGMCTHAMAADITMSGTGNQYDAYRILNLTTSIKSGDTHTDGNHTSACYAYSYSVNEKYRDALKTAMGNASASDADIIDYISGLDEAGIRTFADALFTAIGDIAVDESVTGDNATFSGVDQGYYLITEAGTIADGDSRSLVMLDTAGQEDITVKTKEDVPTSTKKIKDEEGNICDATDVDKGDTVSFVLTGTLPENISGYKTYVYKFHDTITGGLIINEDSVTVKIDGTVVSSGFTTTISPDGSSMVVGTDDLVSVAKGMGITLTKNTSVTVEYNAVLDGERLQIGAAGNPNTVTLEFSNDPYDDGTTHTNEDKVTVFTYRTIVNKVDGSGTALPGASFKLQKWNGTAYVDYLDPSVSSEGTEFTFDGLDAGKYQLVETVTPDGYNTADPVQFEVVSVMDGDDEASDNPSLTELKIIGADGNPLTDFTTNAGVVTTSVVNVAGNKLPSTGGMGTYAFYAGGAVLLLGAGGVLMTVTRKKKSENN